LTALRPSSHSSVFLAIGGQDPESDLLAVVQLQNELARDDDACVDALILLTPE
jgi:hypothetical protein